MAVEFKDRRIERENTFNVLNNKDGTVTLIPVTGQVYEAGTALNAQNLNVNFKEINEQMADKVNKIGGKGLSTNDFDNIAKLEVEKIKNKMEATKGSATNKFSELYLGDFLATEYGYAPLPNGYIFQWGRVVVTLHQASIAQTADITFPVTFPTKCLGAVATCTRNSGWDNNNSASNINSSIYVENNSSAKVTGVPITQLLESMNMQITWFAIGR